MQITTIGLDIAKNVFQVHGIDATEKVVVRKRLRRSQVIEFFAALPPCPRGGSPAVTAPCKGAALVSVLIEALQEISGRVDGSAV